MTEKIEMYCTADIRVLLQGCSYSKARRVFNRILSTMPKKDRKPEHKFHLPKDKVDAYFNPHK